jgi:hypothetical protein
MGRFPAKRKCFETPYLWFNYWSDGSRRYSYRPSDGDCVEVVSLGVPPPCQQGRASQRDLSVIKSGSLL